MLPPLVFQLARRVLPRVASGQALHRRALDAAARGDARAAERWFERAARCYRDELAVEPLARLRVHQLMTRARTRSMGERKPGGPGAGAHGPGPGVEPPRVEAGAELVEIVRLLSRLDRLERLESPHDLADARSVLAEWIDAESDDVSDTSGLAVPATRVA